MRTVLVAFSLLASAAFAQVAFVYPDVVNLDSPGALEGIAQSNPAHYARIVEIRRAVSLGPCRPESVARTLKAKYDAEDGRCGSILYASYPAMMDLGFRLEQTYYTTRISMDTSYDRLTPLIQPAVERRIK